MAYIMICELAFTCDMSLPGHETGSSRRSDVLSPLFFIGVVCSVLGGALRKWSYAAMGRHFTFKLSILKDHQLITDGPYAYVRHPGYTALILTFFGMSGCQLSAGSWWVETRVYDSILGKCVSLLSACAALHLVTVVSRASVEDRGKGGENALWSKGTTRLAPVISFTSATLSG